MIFDKADAFNKRYNVEYELGNGKIFTFSNVLKNVDDGFFWFCSREEGLAFIRQDRIITMVSVKEDRNKPNKTEVFKMPTQHNKPIFSILIQIISDCLKINQKEIIPDSRLVDDLGVDSLDMIQIMMAIEEEFEFEFSDKETEGMSMSISVRELIEVILSKLQ